MRKQSAALLVALALAAGCNLPLGLGNDDRDLLRVNMQRWERRGFDSYDLVIERLCYCGFIGPVRVSVRDGTITERVIVESGEPVSGAFGDAFPGVPGLFEIVDDAIDRNAADLDVEYDNHLGVPQRIAIDYRENVIDEELTVVVKSLVAR